ncbi:AAA family ATPase [Desulforamulus hydrothermalis]|uniref:Nuclease SbcCD subunit C n=1 Tax=Desulforamulus hydrothermalis Lam5 = DSM 18033 TaxID=1121428 RepID=K8DY12_9FIRM|nr:SMC family ATPase [Desulforamulus hydrothermalis]CCO07657.1 SMC domain protein [Desulforamulus hydrothermalis Lam5 = DSM 18033]SHH24682.1 exonuclease SbcC [Desulforamulus hydrothermalis Lam5 = DSM 18033]
MWIQKIRLKNIKSYGEGENGRGITIYLEPGVNQIAGKNGSGKSTLIEAIGYVLFDAEPVRGNARMAKNTYLLRNGSKAGEIDVWVWHQDCLYRVERDVGNGGRRWKVVREDDDFIEAEGEQEVRKFLARLAGVAKPERLTEVFHSLLGVKQGRFTLPFDLKPGDAKNHFDPLLDVDIFRQCFEYLKQPCDEIGQDIVRQEVMISRLEGQLAQLADAPDKLAEVLGQQAALAQLVQQCQERLDDAARRLAEYDLLQTKYQTAKLQLGEARGKREQAGAAVAADTARWEEARRAAELLQQTREDYEAYIKLEKLINQLEKQRLERDNLNKELTFLQKEETILSKDLAAKQQEAARDKESAAGKERQYQERLAVWQQQVQCHRAGEADARRCKQQAEELKNCLVQVVEWLRAMSAVNKPAIQQLAELAHNLNLLDNQVAARLALAKDRLAEAESRERACWDNLERAKRDKVILEQQLEKLSGGQCPLLGTACSQFNPDKARQDLQQLNRKISVAAAEHQEKLKLLAEAGERLEEWRALEKEQLEKQARIRQLGKSIAGLYQQLEDSRGRQAAAVLAAALKIGEQPPKLKGLTVKDEINLDVYRAAVQEMKELQKLLYDNFEKWKPLVEQQYNAAQENLTVRLAHSKELAAEEKALQALAGEIASLHQSSAEAARQAADLADSLVATRRRIQELESLLQPFADLDEKLASANRQKICHQAGYTTYLENRPVAERIQEYQNRLAQSTDQLRQAEIALAAAELACQAAEAAYRPDQHQELKEIYARANLELGEAASKLAEANRAVEEQTQRVNLLNGLQRQRDEQVKELLHLQAQKSILEKARQVLKNAQEPLVRNLTGRVAAQAQVIYNSMSNEAAQFQWRAADYSLTVATVSGEKRFASLSGGQQMKAALAMQLALVKEFSAAGFCAFDEPTYGLDAESRQMLAEAVMKAQQECRFEQLLLVSHDQAFDDKVEHALHLNYSPVEGTKL